MNEINKSKSIKNNIVNIKKIYSKNIYNREDLIKVIKNKYIIE